MKIKIPPDRIRKDLGDLSGLMDSIAEIGLLQAIGVSEDDVLIFGARRLEAWRRLGRPDESIPKRVFSLMDIVMGEFAENSFRKDLTPSEAWALYQAIKPIEEAAAKARQGTRTDLQHGADFARSRAGKSRERAASHTGFSHTTLSHVGEVIQAADADARYRPFVDEMDLTGRPDPVWRRFRQRRQLNEARERSAAQRKSNSPVMSSRVKYGKDGITLIHGDGRQMSELEDEIVDLVITDPPFNVSVKYGPEVNDNLDPAEYARWIRELLDECLRVLKPGGQLYAVMSEKFMPWWMGEIEDLWLEHRGHVLSWCKSTAHMHRENTWIRAWEPVLWLTKGGVPAVLKRTFEFEDDCDWFVSSSAVGEIHALGLDNEHPAPRPVSLYERFIMKCSEPGMLVVDPMMGSGAGAVAAAKTGRRFAGYDIVERYVYLTEKRVENSARDSASDRMSGVDLESNPG